MFFIFQLYISNVVGIQSEGNRKFIPKNILLKKQILKFLIIGIHHTLKIVKQKLTYQKQNLNLKRFWSMLAILG